jgi:hypothetical protein
MRLLDAAKHDGSFNAIGLEGVDQFVELTNLDPVDTVDMTFEFRLCFADMRNRRDIVPQLSGIVRKDDGEATITGNEPNPFAIDDVR